MLVQRQTQLHCIKILATDFTKENDETNQKPKLPSGQPASKTQNNLVYHNRRQTSFTQKSVGGKVKSLNGKQYLKGHDKHKFVPMLGAAPCVEGQWSDSLIYYHGCTDMTLSHYIIFFPLPHFLNFLEISSTVYMFLYERRNIFSFVWKKKYAFKKAFIMKATVSSYSSLCLTSQVNTTEHKLLFQYKAV